MDFTADTKYIIVDLDGTTCDTAHRVGFAQAGEWDEFHARCVDDKPVAAVVEILRIIEFASSVGWPVEILAVTGRNERYRSLTNEWFLKHKVPIDELLMRPDDNFEQDVQMKLGLIEAFMAEKYGPGKAVVLSRVLFAIDDRDRVVEGFRAYGFPCWQVAEGKY